MKKILSLFFLAYFFVFGILLNYENAWMHPEVANTTTAVLTDHPTVLSRISQGWNWQAFEGNYEGRPNCRPRILSHFFQTVNILFRNWLFQFVPPHPSLSLTWILALAFSPFFLYKLMVNLIGNKTVAAATALIYLVLPGNLIPIIMLFHPGKVFANFFYIFLLYKASCLDNRVPHSRKKFRNDFLPMMAWLFFALFFDEYALFLLVLIPAVFPGLFTGREKNFRIISFLTVPLLFTVTVIFILPRIYETAGHPGFNMLVHADTAAGFPWLGFATAPVNFFLMLHDNLGTGITAYLRDESIQVTTTSFLSFNNKLVNADNIRFGLSILNDKAVTPFKILYTFIAFAFFAAGGLAYFHAKSDEDKRINFLFLRICLSMALFTFFFSFVHIANNILSGCGWYGCSFSVLFAVAAGLSLHILSSRIPKAKWPAAVFAAALVVSSLWNVRLLNYAWLSMHHRMNYWELDMWLNKISREELYKKYCLRKEKNNYAVTVRAWQNRSDSKQLEESLYKAAPEVRNYLKAELPFIRPR